MGQDYSFGTDLTALWDTGRRVIPAIASDISVSAADVAGFSDDEMVFRRDPIFGGVLGPAYGPWTQFRDELASIMRQTAANLEATGHALILAADGYDGADQQAKDALRKRENDLAAAEARAAQLGAHHLRMDL